MDHESLKIETEENIIVGNVNESDVDMKDHQQDQQLLLMLNGPI
jgi:hypothetical protein